MKVEPGKLAAGIEDLLAHPAELEQMADAGYRAWQDRFTWEKITLEYERLYREAIRWINRCLFVRNMVAEPLIIIAFSRDRATKLGAAISCLSSIALKFADSKFSDSRIGLEANHILPKEPG